MSISFYVPQRQPDQWIYESYPASSLAEMHRSWTAMFAAGAALDAALAEAEASAKMLRGMARAVPPIK